MKKSKKIILWLASLILASSSILATDSINEKTITQEYFDSLKEKLIKKEESYIKVIKNQKYKLEMQDAQLKINEIEKEIFKDGLKEKEEQLRKKQNEKFFNEIENEVLIKEETKRLSKDIETLNNKEIKSQKYINKKKVKVYKLIKEQEYIRAKATQEAIKEKYTFEENKTFKFFFKAIEGIQKKEGNYNSLIKVENETLIENFFMFYIYLVEKRLLKDKNTATKLKEVIPMIKNEYLSKEEKKRKLIKLNILQGRYVEAYSITHQIENENEIDIVLKSNLLLFIKNMEKQYLKRVISIDYKHIEIYNTKVKSKNWR